MKQAYFETLNQALESENLIDQWPFGTNLSYGQTMRIISNDEKLLISVYRSDSGRYERPIWYKL